MATFQQVLIQALTQGSCRIDSINKSLTEVSKKTSKKPAFLKIITTDGLAASYMSSPQEKTGFLIHIDGDVLNEIARAIDLEEEVTA